MDIITECKQKIAELATRAYHCRQRKPYAIVAYNPYTKQERIYSIYNLRLGFSRLESFAKDNELAKQYGYVAITHLNEVCIEKNYLEG